MKHNAPTKIIYVIDTSALIKDPDIINELKGDIVIPFVVIKQLDGLKRSADTSLATRARKASAILDAITSAGDPNEGIELPNGSIFRFKKDYDSVDILDSIADNKIVGTAVRLKRETGSAARVVILTTDVNMKLAARGLGIEAEDSSSVYSMCPLDKSTYLTRKIEELITKMEPKDLAEEELLREMLALGINPEDTEPSKAPKDLAEEELNDALKALGVNPEDYNLKPSGPPSSRRYVNEWGLSINLGPFFRKKHTGAD